MGGQRYIEQVRDAVRTQARYQTPPGLTVDEIRRRWYAKRTTVASVNHAMKALGLTPEMIGAPDGPRLTRRSDWRARSGAASPPSGTAVRQSLDFAGTFPCWCYNDSTNPVPRGASCSGGEVTTAAEWQLDTEGKCRGMYSCTLDEDCSGCNVPAGGKNFELDQECLIPGKGLWKGSAVYCTKNANGGCDCRVSCEEGTVTYSAQGCSGPSTVEERYAEGWPACGEPEREQDPVPSWTPFDPRPSGRVVDNTSLYTDPCGTPEPWLASMTTPTGWTPGGCVDNQSTRPVLIWWSGRATPLSLPPGANTCVEAPQQDIDHVRDVNGQWYKIGVRSARVDKLGRVQNAACEVPACGAAGPLTCV